MKEFLAISRRFPSISESFRAFSKILRRLSEVHTNISDHFSKNPKMSEDYQRLPNISEQSSKKFRSTIKLGKLDSRYDIIDIFTYE